MVAVAETLVAAAVAKAHADIPVTVETTAEALVVVVVANKPPVRKAHVLHKVADVAPWVTHNHAAMKVVLPVPGLNRAHPVRPLALNQTPCAPASI